MTRTTTATQVRIDVFGDQAGALIPGKRYEVMVEDLDRERTARRLILREVQD